MTIKDAIITLNVIYERLEEEKWDEDILNDYKLNWYMICIEDLKKITWYDR